MYEVDDWEELLVPEKDTPKTNTPLNSALDTDVWDDGKEFIERDYDKSNEQNTCPKEKLIPVDTKKSKSKVIKEEKKKSKPVIIVPKKVNKSTPKVKRGFDNEDEYIFDEFESSGLNFFEKTRSF